MTTFEKLVVNDIFRYKSSYYRKMGNTHGAWILEGSECRKCEPIPPDAEVELALHLGDYLPLPNK